MKKAWLGIFVGAWLLMVWGLSPVWAQEFSGAFYVGDSNGNGFIEPADISRAQQKYATGNADYSQVEPPFADVAELNGNGFVDPPDFQILQYWYINQFPARTGVPATVTAVGATSPGFMGPGDSVEICVEVRDSALSGDMIATDRSGWGVNFRVDPTAGLCTTAMIYGRNPWPAVKDDVGYFNPKAYEYTDRMAPNGNGRACVRVVAPLSGCEGLEIKVLSYIPGDTEALCNGLPAPCFGTRGRMAAQLDGPTFIMVVSGDTVLMVTPDPANLDDGGMVALTATDSVDGDVTQSVNTTWSVTSGPCTVGNVAPNKGEVSVAEGCTAGACIIEAVYDPGAPRSDTGAVNVADNEAGTYNALTATVCGDIADGAGINCATPDRISSDGCNRGAAVCSWSCSGDCGELCMPVTGGSYTGRCTDGAVFSEDAANVANDEQTATVNVSPEGPIPILDGATVAFNCVANYTDGCSRSCAGALADQAGCGSLAGTLYTGAGAPCADLVSASFDGGSDGETVSGTTVVHTVTVTPDPGAVSDGQALQMTATCDIDGNITATAAWTIDSGPCVMSGSTPGLVRASEGCAADTCVVRATEGGSWTDTASIAVTDDDVADDIVLACNDVPDGDSIDCTASYISTADGCTRPGTPTCTTICTAGCTGNNTNELCANGTYNAECLEFSDLVPLSDFESGTLDGWSTIPGSGVAPYNCDGVLYRGGDTGLSVCFNNDGGNEANAILDRVLNTTGYVDVIFTGRWWTCNADSGENSNIGYNCGSGWVWPQVKTGNGACSTNREDFSFQLPSECLDKTAIRVGVRAPASDTENNEWNMFDNLRVFGYAQPGSGPAADTAAVIDNEAGTFSQLTIPTCNALNDPAYPVGGVDCTTPNRLSSDGCNRGPANCAWTFVGTGVEYCTNSSYTGRCTDGAIFSEGTGVVVDNDVWDSLSQVSCVPSNDPVNVSVFCTRPNRISSADGCNRGLANCAWTCAGACGELCMPVTSGSYTGRCTDGAYFSEDGSTVINNEPAQVNVSPEGPFNLLDGQTVHFSCSATYADLCPSENCAADLADPPGCGSLAGSLYTAAGATCTETVSASLNGGSDGETVFVWQVTLTVTPDPANINDGETLRMTATDSVDGDVTQNINTVWSTNFPCTVSNVAPDKGLVSAPESCSAASCLVRAVYNPGVSREDSVTVNVVDDLPDAILLDCVTVNDGAPIDCTASYISTADGCPRPGAPTCVPACTAGCTGNITTEGCADSTYEAECLEPGGTIIDLVPLTDFESGTLDGWSTIPGSGWSAFNCDGALYGGDSGLAVCFNSDASSEANAILDQIINTTGYVNVVVTGRWWTCNADSGENTNVGYDCGTGWVWPQANTANGACSTNRTDFSLALPPDCFNQAAIRIGIKAPSSNTESGEFNLVDNLRVYAAQPAFGGTDTAATIDNEIGTWNEVRDLVCDPVNDGMSMASSCYGARRYSTADSCDRGAASCTYTCTGGCTGTNVTELCVTGTYTGRCTDGAYYVSDGGTAIDNETGTWNGLRNMTCANANDGESMLARCSGARRYSIADSCDRGPAVCAISCTAGCIGTNIPEGCSNGIYTGRCDDGLYNVSDDGTAVDNEAGTWNMLTAITCPTMNDPANCSSCSVPHRISSDGCDRGSATCSWSCAGSCSELCMPVTSGAATCRCTDGPWVEAGATITNNELVPVSTDIVPDDPAPMGDFEGRAFACLATYADACTESCSSALTTSGAAPPPCGMLAGATYTCANSPCNENITATWRTVSGQETQYCGVCCDGPPNIVTVFPLSGQPGIPQRNWSNAHTNQVLTAVMQPPATGVGYAAGVTATCTGPSTVNFTCSLAGYPADHDIPCTPTSSFVGSGTYSCTVTATNSFGNDVVTANIYTALTSSPTDGGHAGGYVGGNLWDSATNTCDAGPVTICGVNMQTNAAILEKIYVQIRQAGEPVVERFTSAGTGCVTVNLPCKAIDELHLGFKCGLASCPKLEDGATTSQYKNSLTRNYTFTTVTGVDARDVVERMALMDDGIYNRWKQRVQGTIGENYFTSYISVRTNGADNGVRLRPHLFNPPVKFRAAFVFTTLSGLREAGDALDLMLLSSDYEVSITFCLIRRNNVDMPLNVVLPPNLIIPEIRRTNWTGGCQNFSVNPGRYTWEYWLSNPSQNRNLWAAGVYINATNFASLGSLDPFSFPIAVCGLGTYGVTPAANLTGDPILNIGTNAGFRYDLREDWPGTLGYDPDTAVDRKVLFSVRGKALPIDPARMNASLRPISTYRVPNYTDSEVIGDATWDDRFYRRNVGVVSGADFGVAAGLGITGLNLDARIDDQEFTTFKVGYFNSTGSRGGNRDLRYFSGSTGDTEAASAQQAGIATTWTNPTFTNINFAPIETGGFTNYAGIAVLMRPLALDGRSTDRDLAQEGKPNALTITGFNPGSVLGVWHIGPLESAGNETIPVSDFLNMPLAQAPGPDEYVYPGPQWANTIRATRPINRNGELWRYLTAGTGDSIPNAAGRYYFQFSRPTFQYAASRAVHLWTAELAEPGYRMASDGVSSRAAEGKYSLKSRVMGTDGFVTGVNEFNDTDARFQSWGVAAGDSLWINSWRVGCGPVKLRITSAPSQTRIYVTPNFGVAPNCLAPGDTNVRYRIFRANKRGECKIDEGYGGGPGGYFCKPNTFWRAQGPANANPVRVYVPALTPGPTTLAGTTGYVPAFWDGLTVSDLVVWRYGMIVFNTGNAILGGLGGPFDFNNWESRKDELAFQHGGFDQAVVIRQ